jgi:hypothetical protein
MQVLPEQPGVLLDFGQQPGQDLGDRAEARLGGLAGLVECVIHACHDLRMRLHQVTTQDDEVMARIDTAAPEVGLLDANKIRIQAPQRTVGRVEAGRRPRTDQRVDGAVDQHVDKQAVCLAPHSGRQRIVGHGLVSGAHLADEPVDRTDIHALLAQESACPGVARGRPLVDPDAFAGQVGQLVERAVTTHKEAPLAEAAHDEDGQPDQRPIAARKAEQVASERCLTTVHLGRAGGYPRQGVPGADQLQIDAVGADVAVGERLDVRVVARDQGDGHLPHR